MSEAPAPSARFKLPRPLKWLAVACGILLVLLIALGIGLRVFTNRFLRPVVEEQASIAIPGEVSIARLGVSLLGMSVTLDGVSIRPDLPESKPVLEVGRLSVSLARLPLFSRQIVVDEIQIESPVVRVIRQPSGELDLLKVLIPETPENAPSEAPESDSIPVRVRQLDLGAGRIEFLDKSRPGAEPLTIQIPRSLIENAIVTGEPGEDRSDLEVEVTTQEGASIGLKGNFHRDGDQLDVDATVEASKLPLARSRIYLPDLGWTDLAGEVDAKIHYVHVTGATQTADGTIALRDLRVGVPSLKDPALSVPSLSIGIDKLDLLGRSIALGDVKLSKPRLFIDPSDLAKLPLLPKGFPSSDEPPEPNPAAPFAWSLKSFELEGAELVPLDSKLPSIAIEAKVADLASPVRGVTDVVLKLAQANGTLALEGKAFSEPPGFNGKLKLDAWALGPLLGVVAAAQTVRVDGGVANGEIQVKVGSLAAGETPASGGDFFLDGTLTIDKLDVKSDAEGTLGAKVEKIALNLKTFELPGLLPPPAEEAPVASAGAVPTAPAPEPAVPAAPPAEAAAAPMHDSEQPTAAPGVSPPGAAAPAAPPPAPAAPTAPPPGFAAPARRWAPPENAGRLRAVGTLGIDGVAVRTTKGEPLSFDLGSLALTLQQLELPGALVPKDASSLPEDAGRLRLGGTLGLSGFALKSGKEGEFGFEFEKLDLAVKQLDVPRLLPPPGVKPSTDPIRVTLERARINRPRLRVTRTDQGIVLPAGAGAEAKPSEAPPPSKTEAPDKPAKASSEPALRLEIGTLALEAGTLRFVDRTVKPFYQGDLAGLTVNARDVSFPPPQVRDISLKVDAPGPAPLWLLGAYTPASSWYELNLEKLPLAPLNPYVRDASGYVVTDGDLSLYSKGSVTDGRLYAANWLTLFDPDVSGGGPESPLEKAVGVPVSMVLSLLKDASGNIGLSIPVDYDEKGASLRLGSVIGSAVKQVLIGALTSPLKLLGAAVDATGTVKKATPEPVSFLPGSAELAASADERVSALAKLAAARPGLVLKLSGQSSGADGQFLREAELHEALDSGEGLPEEARGLGQALLRRRLRLALEARLEGKPVELDPEDAAKLETYLAAMQVGPEKLTELARKRSARVQELLQSDFGLDAAQIQQGEPGPPGGSPEPSVDVSVGS